MIKNIVNRIRRFIHPPVLGGIVPSENKFENVEIRLHPFPKKGEIFNTPRRKSRLDIVELMKNSGGRFFTVVFIKADGTERTINGQVKKDDFFDNLGYINFRESNGNYRKVNPKTIKEISISKQIYKVN